MSSPRLFLFVLVVMLMSVSCSRGPVKLVSPPTASIQQLTVHADGSWAIDLRLQNYSTVPMRIDRVALALDVDGHDAGLLEGTPAISISARSSDLLTLTLRPQSLARLASATALAERRALPYQLKGTVLSAPDNQKPREFDIQFRSRLNPAPGLEGVLR